MIFLLVAGALIVGAPILATILVSVASLREDAQRSLAGRPPGQLTAAARRLLSVRADSVQRADTGPAGGRLPHVPRPRLADHEQAEDVLPVPRP
ncbi:MAG: hypothetical protein ACLQFR_06585 [Streptosporangiaceae bacterium]